jgi:hypothetical protein
MSLPRQLAVILTTLIVVLVVADVVGVIACFILDVAPMRHKSAGLGYAIWLVLGIFAGLIFFSMARDFASGRDPDTPGNLHADASTGRLVLLTAGAVLVALSALFWTLFWQGSASAEFAVVPDHMATTLVFFVAFGAGMLVARHAAAPAGPEAGPVGRK